MNQPKISVFPKCYFDDLCSGQMDYIEWIHMAKDLGAEGIEHYDGFFKHVDIEPVMQAMKETGQASSLLCFSPDFTYADQTERNKQIERQKQAIDLSLRLGLNHCRTLSGQAFPDMDRQDGVHYVVESINACLEYAAEKQVTLCMENHYKDGNWKYPEFAMPEKIYLEIISQIDSPWFGVQYDPSNAIVGGYDPVEFLKKVKHRVVSMHASDRSLAPGASLEELKEADGATGYSEKLVHGVIGKGLNDFDAIFEILAEVNYSGWISVEDGVNGLGELKESIEFLKDKRNQYFS